MKRMLCALMCLCLVVGLAGCSGSPPQPRLIEKFKDYEEEINTLSNEEARKYLECANQNPDFSFEEVKENVIIYKSNAPQDLINLIENMKSYDVGSDSWDMKNISIQNLDERSYIKYDLYSFSEDTNIDLLFVFNPASKSILAICMDADVNEINVDGVKAILLYVTMTINIDESLSNNVSKASEIVSDALDKLDEPVTYNDWAYSFITNENRLTYMAVPINYMSNQN